MAWYSARLLFECDVEDGQKVDPLCEVSIRLIKATDEIDAEKKAHEVGINEQCEYKNENGARVKWRFVRAIEIQDLCEEEIFHGVEVYSYLFRQNSCSKENTEMGMPLPQPENREHGNGEALQR